MGDLMTLSHIIDVHLRSQILARRKADGQPMTHKRLRVSVAEVARVVGEGRRSWSNYLSGRSPTEGKIVGWLVAAKASGLPMVLSWDAEAVWAVADE